MKFINSIKCVLALVFSLSMFGCQNQARDPHKKSDQPPVKVEQESAIKEVSVAQQAAKRLTDQQATTPTTEFKPFYIYADKGSFGNHFVPSGFMPNGKCLAFEDTWSELCYEGSSCIKVEYDVACSRDDQQWAGVYWLNPANNWGRKKGGYDLRGARQLTFWARGENGGEQIMEFIVGGIDGGDFPDTDIAVLGPVILTKSWKKYTIDLTGKDLTYISGGFAWSTSVEVNPDNCIFYLDEIRYE